MPESVENHLYIVSTPIGNLGDISHRAISVLKGVGVIAAEDTRVTSNLLNHFGIRSPLLALHEHNQQQQSATVLKYLEAGKGVALVSDAGTPLISDPGAILVNNVLASGFEVIAVPGASALLAALVTSGLPSQYVAFAGFLDSKSTARKKTLAKIDIRDGVFICYESPKRIVAFLQDCVDVLGSDRRIFVGRELTKRFETVYRGRVIDVKQQIEASDHGERGEIVVVIETHQKFDDVSLEEAVRIAQILKDELPAAKAAKLAAKISGVDRAKLYELLANGN